MADTTPPPRNKKEHLPRVQMPEVDAQERVQSFMEVPLGYTEEQARLEASRCLRLQASQVHRRLPGQYQYSEIPDAASRRRL